LMGTFAGNWSDLAPWLKGAEINRDRNLRLQYLAGLGLNAFESGRIYQEMLNHRSFPEDLFVASEDRKLLLRKEMKTTPPAAPIAIEEPDAAPTP
jgi:spermidine synthase